jgi:hypothetical protein
MKTMAVELTLLKNFASRLIHFPSKLRNVMKLAEYHTQSHEAAIGEILESFGLNPRIAAIHPR